MNTHHFSSNSSETSAHSSLSGFIGQPSNDDRYDLKTAPASTGRLYALRKIAENQIASLTPRQHQVLRLVLAGLPSKNIATALGISRRTVENHRASIMKKTGSKSIPALACLAFTASANDPEELFVQCGFQFQTRNEM